MDVAEYSIYSFRNLPEFFSSLVKLFSSFFLLHMMQNFDKLIIPQKAV